MQKVVGSSPISRFKRNYLQRLIAATHNLLKLRRLEIALTAA
jgi:hypothetical protein